MVRVSLTHGLYLPETLPIFIHHFCTRAVRGEEVIVCSIGPLCSPDWLDGAHPRRGKMAMSLTALEGKSLDTPDETRRLDCRRRAVCAPLRHGCCAVREAVGATARNRKRCMSWGYASSAWLSRWSYDPLVA